VGRVVASWEKGPRRRRCCCCCWLLSEYSRVQQPTWWWWLEEDGGTKAATGDRHKIPISAVYDDDFRRCGCIRNRRAAVCRLVRVHILVVRVILDQLKYYFLLRLWIESLSSLSSLSNGCRLHNSFVGPDVCAIVFFSVASTQRSRLRFTRAYTRTSCYQPSAF
jgi:hypothetical protein